jgi:hypothetical protein
VIDPLIPPKQMDPALVARLLARDKEVVVPDGMDPMLHAMKSIFATLDTSQDTTLMYRMRAWFQLHPREFRLEMSRQQKAYEAELARRRKEEKAVQKQKEAEPVDEGETMAMLQCREWLEEHEADNA